MVKKELPLIFLFKTAFHVLHYTHAFYEIQEKSTDQALAFRNKYVTIWLVLTNQKICDEFCA